MNPKQVYMICTSPRSGSNLLCEILTNCGVAGQPHEYLHEHLFPEWFKAFEVTNVPEYLKKVFAKKCTPNGVFGFKHMGGKHFEDLIKNLRKLPAYRDRNISRAELMSEFFPNLNYIWLTRRDKVRQAISFSKAFQTDIWRSSEIGQRVKNQTEPVYLYKEIEYWLKFVTWHDITWQRYFDEAGITPLTLVYEDYIQHLEDTVQQILNYLDIPLPADWTLGKVGERKLADTTSEIWAQRFTEQFRTELFAYRHVKTEASQPAQPGSDSSDLPLKYRPIYRQVIQSLSGEDIAQQIPIRRIIQAIAFKARYQPGLRWLSKFRGLGKNF